MSELIITEKPNAAKKIADALADGKPIKESINKVPFYKITRGNKDILVGCAVGHLYGLAEKEKNGWKYPVFDIHWVPTADMSRGSAFSKKYLSALKKLSKEADEFTVATDYDIEGEVIGLNVVRYICKKKDANRMKFSTLTKPDLIKAYENKSNTLNWGQAKAGETRHMMDWFYGINTSRALTAAIKSTGDFKILSTGRVQGPALKIIVEREKEINAFVPVPYWQIQLLGNTERAQEAGKSNEIEAWHKEDQFFDKAKADEVMGKVAGQTKGIVSDMKKREFEQKPPTPFDLTTLQTEAYKCHRISPKETLSIGQELYTGGYISYPRTSSQILPPEIGYTTILEQMKKQAYYIEMAEKLLAKGNLKPNNGTKVDPAHPAIYPTGICPRNLDEREGKIYDLIVRRFFATFAEPAVRETATLDIDVNTEIFISKGTRTTFKGWHEFYGHLLRLEEQELPHVEKGDGITIKELNFLDKETQPPKRYTPSSIIKELEKKGLGTKSTRAAIVDTLFQRSYVEGSGSIKATELGMQTILTLEKYSPKIIDQELTRHFEDDMEEIREGKKTEDDVLSEVKDVLGKILEEFKDNKDQIGQDLKGASRAATKRMTTVGKCPNCAEGELTIRKGKFGRFVACNKHPDCSTTFSLPANGIAKVSEKVCEHCQHPMILMIRKGKQPQEVCINKDCSSKQVDESKIEEKDCPRCKEAGRDGKMLLRKSVYGQFMGCSKYPKCRYTEKLDGIEKK